MKRKLFNCSLVMGISLLAICALGFSACSNSAAAQSSVTVRLDKTSIEMGVGDTEKLTLSLPKASAVLSAGSQAMKAWLLSEVVG